MEILTSIFLGIVQGLTEFLPISSSGHLVIFQNLLGIKNNTLTLDVFLHLGTLIPVIIIFWEDIYNIINSPKKQRHLIWLILIGIIPAGILGVLFEDFITSLFSSTITTGLMLMVTGVLLYISEKIVTSKKNLNDFNTKNALIVGLMQGLAIIPGISRSGSTIVGSLIQGLNKEDAARYSFLLSIPVILGAGLLQFKDIASVGFTSIHWIPILAGLIAAAIAGYIAIKYLLHILKTGSLVIFSYYCWGLGILIIILAGLF